MRGAPPSQRTGRHLSACHWLAEGSDCPGEQFLDGLPLRDAKGPGMTDRHGQRPYRTPGLRVRGLLPAAGMHQGHSNQSRSISKVSGRCPDKICLRHERSGHGAAQAPSC